MSGASFFLKAVWGALVIVFVLIIPVAISIGNPVEFLDKPLLPSVTSRNVVDLLPNPDPYLKKALVDEFNKPDVFILHLADLIQLYLVEHGIYPPTEVPLRDLTKHFPDYKPAFLPANGYDLKDRLLLSASILDLPLAENLAAAINQAGFDPLAIGPENAAIAFFKDALPAHYPSEEVVVDWRTGEIVLYPTLDLASELNIPAFLWRIYLLTENGRHLLAEFPVVVGKPSTRTPVAELPFDQVHHYPPWTDPETGKYVDPGPRNPLGIWKVKSSHTKRLWYYHGTNMPRLLNNRYRAYSHGCIRNDNDNIRRLSWLLLSHNAGDEWAPGLVTGRLDVLHEQRTRLIQLVREIDGRNIYDTITVEARDPAKESLISLHPDIYPATRFPQYFGKQYRVTSPEHLFEEMALLGFTPEDFDRPTVNRLLHKTARSYHPTVVPVASLLKP